ncbi:MAG: DNA polymerase III subunit gamma/tau [Fibrobacterota bacterium]|nr:MAG: DNA polymerase III subunit gamma/tau [Fibrobacterota bacterium]
MSYQAMARRWRPRRFEDMVGQEHVARTLRNSLVRGNLHHAFLFTGTRGVGKTTSARILARMLNCGDEDPQKRPCGTCPSCVEIEKGASMDVLEIDAASHTGVDDVRELREQLKYASSHGKYRVVILDEVHMLSKAAFNALLKTLEEPPPHVVFILATTEVHKVPQTILSRVQRYDFRRLTPGQVRDRLAHICQVDGIEVDAEALDIVALRADGSMRDGLSLFDQVYAYAGNKVCAEDVRRTLGVPDQASHQRLLTHLVAGDVSGSVGEVHLSLERGVDPLEYIRGFGEFLRNVLFCRLDGLPDGSLSLMPERVTQLREITKTLAEGDLLRWARMVAEVTQQMRDAHNPRLALEVALARMASLDKVADLRRLISGQALPPVSAGSPAAASAPMATNSAPGAVAPPPRRAEPDPRAKGPNLQQAVEGDPVLGRLLETFDATPTSE